MGAFAVIWEQRKEGRGQVILKGKTFPGRGVSKCIDPDVGISFFNLKSSRKAGVARIEERKC